MARPRKPEQVTCKVYKTDNLRVIDAAAVAGMSVPDYLHTLLNRDENNGNLDGATA
jgi:hypothetical protein